MDTTRSKVWLVYFIVIIGFLPSSNGQDVQIIAAFPFLNGIRLSLTYPPEDAASLLRIEVQVVYRGPCEGANVQTRVFGFVANARLLQTPELIPFSEYDVTVAAVSSTRTSINSTTVTTSPTSPGPPINIRATDLTTSSATIEWDPVPCLQQNGDILEYRVAVGVSGTVPSFTRTVENGTSLMVSGLSNGGSYFFEVYAVGNESIGTSATPLHLQTLRAPNITATTQVTSATVTWQLPDFNEQILVDPQGHNITYTYAGPCTGEVSQSLELSLTEGEARSAEIEGLMPFSNYTVTVESIYPNDVVSTTRLITTLPSVPDEPPHHISIVRITDTEISITWDHIKCPNRNSIITGYQVLYGLTSSYPDEQHMSNLTTNLSISLHELLSNTSYSFQVFPVPAHQLEPGSSVPRTGIVSVITQVQAAAVSPTSTGTASGEVGLQAGIPDYFLIVTGSLVGIILAMGFFLICTLAICWRQHRRKSPSGSKGKPALNMTTFESMQMEGCQAYIPNTMIDLHSPPPTMPPPPLPADHDLVTSTSNQYDSIRCDNYNATDLCSRYNTLDRVINPDNPPKVPKGPKAPKAPKVGQS